MENFKRILILSLICFKEVNITIQIWFQSLLN